MLHTRGRSATYFMPFYMRDTCCIDTAHKFVVALCNVSAAFSLHVCGIYLACMRHNLGTYAVFKQNTYMLAAYMRLLRCIDVACTPHAACKCRYTRHVGVMRIAYVRHICRMLHLYSICAAYLLHERITFVICMRHI